MKNKKKKQLPLLLLALLFITTAAYGTRAYFTDNASQDSGISLQVGNLSIDPDDANSIVWKYTPLNGNANAKLGASYHSTTNVIDDPKEITNVQPGDAFTGVFTFKNTGSLIQVVEANNTFITANGNDIFEIIIDDSLFKNADANSKQSVVLEPGDTVSVQLLVSVKTGDELNVTHNKTTENPLTDNSIAMTAIQGALTVTAVQTK